MYVALSYNIRNISNQGKDERYLLSINLVYHKNECTEKAINLFLENILISYPLTKPEEIFSCVSRGNKSGKLYINGSPCKHQKIVSILLATVRKAKLFDVFNGFLAFAGGIE